MTKRRANASPVNILINLKDKTMKITTHRPTLAAVLVTAAVCAALFAACTDRDDPALTSTAGDTPVALTAAISAQALPNGSAATRTATNLDGEAIWTAGDSIAIFMLTAGGTLANSSDDPDPVLPGARNKRYFVTPSTGVLTPDDGTPLYYPQSPGAVDFIGIYPYSAAYAAGRYCALPDMDDQSTLKRQASFDLLYSRNATGVTRSADPLQLQFRHVLSKLRFNIILDDDLVGNPVEEVRLSNFPYQCSIDLQDGTVTALPVTPQLDITTLCLSEITTDVAAIYTALVPPHDEQSGMTGRTITVTVDGATYTGTIPDADAYAAGNLYIYPVTVQRTGITVGAFTIGGWTVLSPIPGGAKFASTGSSS